MSNEKGLEGSYEYEGADGAIIIAEVRVAYLVTLIYEDEAAQPHSYFQPEARLLDTIQKDGWRKFQGVVEIPIKKFIVEPVRADRVKDEEEERPLVRLRDEPVVEKEPREPYSAPRHIPPVPDPDRVYLGTEEHLYFRSVHRMSGLWNKWHRVRWTKPIKNPENYHTYDGGKATTIYAFYCSQYQNDSVKTETRQEKPTPEEYKAGEVCITCYISINRKTYVPARQW